MPERGTPAKRKRDEKLVMEVVRKRLRANGDWNINDWKDAARILANQVEELLGEVGRGN